MYHENGGNFSFFFCLAGEKVQKRISFVFLYLFFLIPSRIVGIRTCASLHINSKKGFLRKMSFPGIDCVLGEIYCFVLKHQLRKFSDLFLKL